jgi:hypothetical protein
MASDVMFAMMFLGGADPNRYKQRFENHELMYLEGQNQYILVHWLMRISYCLTGQSSHQEMLAAPMMV